MTKNRSKVTEDEYAKPRTFRDRSKKRRSEQVEHDHPLHRPYERENVNWTRRTIDGLGEDFSEEE